MSPSSQELYEILDVSTHSSGKSVMQVFSENVAAETFCELFDNFTGTSSILL
jgi:hypothetical protein